MSQDIIKLISEANDPNDIVFTDEEIKSERWKQYSTSYYYISDLGRIFSTKSNKILQHTLSESNIYHVSLTIGSKRSGHRVHNLVFQTYNLEEDIEDLYVIHKDKNTLNNRFDNLSLSVIPERNYEIHELEALEGEVWKSIYDFPDYQISNKGRVKNDKNYLMKFYLSETGRYILTLYKTVDKERVAKKIEVDRYLMYTFNPVENMLEMIIIHKNNDLLDNIYENLVYKLRNEFRKPKIRLIQTEEMKAIQDAKEKEIDYKNEEWRYIEGSDDQYVSDFGRVKNSAGLRILNQDDAGYKNIAITMNGDRIHFLVHRLVSIVFNPIPDMDDLIVNHKNGIKDDNKLQNLEWCTPSKNRQHAIAMGLCKIFTIPILQIDPQTNVVIAEFKSQEDATRALNLKKSTGINNVLKGRALTSAGYKWEYKESQVGDEVIIPGEMWENVFISGECSNYQISSHGRIKNQIKILKTYKEIDSYEHIVLYLNAHPRRYAIHRLVGIYFLDPPANLEMIVHHKDEDKTNNNYTNLQWITKGDNVIASVGNGNSKAKRLYLQN
jgi:hypothetical protein